VGGEEESSIPVFDVNPRSTFSRQAGERPQRQTDEHRGRGVVAASAKVRQEVEKWIVK
jgi:hypothetical protein